MAENKKHDAENEERHDAELFAAENMVDGAWIPDFHAWDHPEIVKDRARELEDYAGEELGLKRRERKKNNH